MNKEINTVKEENIEDSILVTKDQFLQIVSENISIFAIDNVLVSLLALRKLNENIVWTNKQTGEYVSKELDKSISEVLLKQQKYRMENL